MVFDLNPLSTNHTKWSSTFKQFVCNFATNCLSVFDNFVGLALKGLTARKNYVFVPRFRKQKPSLVSSFSG